MKTLTKTEDGNLKEVIETDTQRITTIYDGQYRFRDFLKPSPLEVGLMILEATPLLPLSEFAYLFAHYFSGFSEQRSLLCLLVPQAGTYVAARLCELPRKKKRYSLLSYLG